MTVTLEIITGVSYFTGHPVVGVAIKGDTVAATKWANTQGSRPATVRMVAAGETLGGAILRHRERFEAWIADDGIDAKISPKVRYTLDAF